MAKTAQFALPLVAPAQAQKHVTVNEALARLDAVAQLRIFASDVSTPPSDIVEGAGYLVPEGADGAWAGYAGQIAIGSNGGWVFVTPRAGWRAWQEDQAGTVSFDGAGWVPDALVFSQSGAATQARVIEFDHSLNDGSDSSTGVAIPNKAQLVGVTGRVVSAIVGPGLAGWRIGVVGADDRYGSGLGLAVNSYLIGLSGAPVTYYADTPLLITAEGGTFASGVVRLALHILELAPPRAV